MNVIKSLGREFRWRDEGGVVFASEAVLFEGGEAMLVVAQHGDYSMTVEYPVTRAGSHMWTRRVAAVHALRWEFV